MPENLIPCPIDYFFSFLFEGIIPNLHWYEFNNSDSILHVPC